MPRYRVTMPDGRTYTINGPAGASQAEVIAAVQRRIGATQEEETTLGGELKEAVKGVIPGAAGLLETAATGAAVLLPEEQEMAVRAKAAELAGAARETFAAAPGYEESTGRKFGEALGSTVPFFALGPMGVAGRAAATGLGVGAGAGEARQRAEMEGGEEEKGLATAAGAVVGATEAIPVFNFVKRLPRDAQLTILDRVRRGFQAAGEEGAQEAAAQVAQNLIARGLYKPSQALLESAGEEGAYGAGVGAFIQVLTDMALGRRARAPQPPPPTAEEKLTQPETPPAAPPGTQAAAREEIAKQTETKETVKQAISDEEDAQEEARREREAIQAYERSVLEQDEELRRYYDEETLREAAAAERLAPVDEDVPYMPPAAPVEEAVTPTVEPEAVEEPAPAVEEPEYTMRDAALEVFRDTGKTNVDTLRDRLAVPLQEAKALRQSLIDEGLLVRRGNTYILQEVKEAPPIEAAEEVTSAAPDIRAGDIETSDVGAVGRGDVLPAPQPVPTGLETAEPAVAGVERVGEPAPVVAEGAGAVEPALEDVEIEDPAARARSIRAAAFDFIRATGKADAVSLQQALGIKLSDAKALREALIGSGAIVPRGRDKFAVFEDLKTKPQAPAREGRIEGQSLSETRPEVLQGAPRPAKKELPVDTAAEEAAVAQARQRRAELQQEVDEIKSSLRDLALAPGVQQFGLDLTGGEARGVTRKKLSQAEVSNATALGVNREAVAYSADPANAENRRALLDALKAKHKELVSRVAALREAEIRSRRNQRETVFKDSFFRSAYNKLRDPQISLRELVGVENNIKKAEDKFKGIAPEVAPEQARIDEDQRQFAEAVERAKEREAAEKEARKARPKRERDIGLRFQRGAGVGMDASKVEDIATKAAANWKNKPNIIVVQSINEVPESIRDKVPNDSRGFHIRGDVWLIADNATTEAGVRATLFHESLGHYGLRSMFGRRIRQVMLDIYRTNPAMREAADKWFKEDQNATTYDYMDRDGQIAMAVEEVMAEASTQGQIKDPVIRAAFNRVAALIRKFIRGMGIQINYSNNDVRQILIDAHGTVISRERENRLGDGTIAFQRKKAEERLSRVFDVNLTAPKYDNKIGDGVRSALSNVYDSLREGAIGLMGIDHIAEVWEKELPAVAVLDNILGQRGATEMRRREHVSTNVTNWFELSNEYTSEQLDKFFRVANMTTIYQVDPLLDSTQAILKKSPAQMTPSDKVAYDIVKEYNAQPDKLRKAYADMRKEYEDSAKEFEKLLEQRLGKDALDRIKSKYDQKKLQVYLPLWRDGQYWMTYTDKNGETISSAYASDVDRQRAKEAALAEGAKDIQEFSRLRDARLGAPPTGFLGDVVKELEDKGVPPDAIDAVYEAYLNYLPAESVRQLRRPREASFDLTTGVDRYGVFGFEPDIFQSYANVAPRIANQLTNLEYAIPLEETMKDLYKQTGGERVRDPMLAAVYRNLQKQVNFIRNPEKNWLVDGASYFSYLWFIAGNISSALINTTQLPMVVAPLLGGRYSYGKAMAAMDKAIGTYMNGDWDSNNGGKRAFPSDFTFGTANNLDRKYKKLYDAAVSRSVIRRSTGYEITEAQKSGVKDFVGTRARVEHGLGWIFQNSERFNREVTLLAAFDLAYEETGDVNKAIEEAIKVVKAAHGSALAETGPRLFQQGFGKVMFTFKRFAQAQIYLLGKLFKQSFGDADPQTREIARSQLIGIFGSSFLIAGIQGMPLFGAVEALANALLGDDDEPFDFEAYVNSKFGETGRKGLLNEIIGVDVASRTGFNGLIWKDDPQRMSEVGVFLYTLEQAMGPSYGAFLSAQRGVELFKEGEYQRSIEAITPSFIRNGFKTLRMAEEGVRNKDGTPVVEDVSAYNLMMQLVGFNPAEVAEARERAGVARKFHDTLIKRRNKLINEFNAAWREGDQKQVDEVWNKIQDYNAKNPQKTYFIKNSTLRRSIKERSERQLQSVDGMYLPLPARVRVNELSGD